MRESPWAVFTVIAIIAILAVFAGAFFVFEVVFYLAFGWAIFLFRVGAQIEWAWGDIGLAAFFIAALTVGAHLFLGSFKFNFQKVEGAVDATPKWTLRKTGAMVGLILLVFSAGIAVVGVVHESIWIATSDQPIVDSSFSGVVGRTDDSNRLRQLAIAAYNHHDARKALPQGTIYGDDGRLLHGWVIQIMPHMELAEMFEQVDMDQAWDSDRNRPVFQTAIPGFVSATRNTAPTFNEGEYPTTDFSSNVHVMGPQPAMTMEEIAKADGTSNTIMLGMATSNPKPWGHPANWRDPSLGLGEGARRFASPYPAGVPMAFGDASIHVLPWTMDRKVLYQLAHPDDGASDIPWDW